MILLILVAALSSSRQPRAPVALTLNYNAAIQVHFHNDQKEHLFLYVTLESTSPRLKSFQQLFQGKSVLGSLISSKSSLSLRNHMFI